MLGIGKIGHRRCARFGRAARLRFNSVSLIENRFRTGQAAMDLAIDPELAFGEEFPFGTAEERVLAPPLSAVAIAELRKIGYFVHRSTGALGGASTDQQRPIFLT